MWLSQFIGDLAESLRIKAFVDVLNGVVHIFLRCRNAAQVVSFRIAHIDIKSNYLIENKPQGMY